jgi:hypothetical protein
MKAKIRGLLAAVLLAGPLAANAAAVTYDFSFSNFTSGPYSTIAGSFSLDGDTLTGFNLTIGSNTFVLADVGVGRSATRTLIGGLVNGIESLVFDTNDFSLLYSSADFVPLSFSYAAPRQGVHESRTGSISARASVPEPGTLALLGLGMAGLAVSRRRKAA